MSTKQCSSRESSTYSFKMFETPPVMSCSHEDLKRLHELMRGVEEAEKKLSEHKKANSRHDLALRVMNTSNEVTRLKMTTKTMTEKLDLLKRICSRKRMLIKELQTEYNKKVSKFEKEKRRAGLVEERQREFQEQYEKRKTVLNVYTNLLRVRRTNLVADLFGVFQIQGYDNISELPYKVECTCKPYFTIKGVHLPTISLVEGHREQTITSALGLVTHLLSVLSTILDYYFRYPVLPGGSLSHVYHPKSDKLYDLYGLRWKSDRVRFLQAFCHISQNISQLRADSGFTTPHMEMTLRVLVDWFQLISENKTPAKYEDRPYNSCMSPALLVRKVEGLQVNGTETERNSPDIRLDIT